MQKFPHYLIPENSNNFGEYRIRLIMEKLRKEITELVLIGNENDYFSLDTFFKEFCLTTEQTNIILDTITFELNNMGWKCKTSFAGSGLFIYSSEYPPPLCYSDDL